MQVGLGDTGSAADALGDVVAGELHMDSARKRPQLAVHLEVPLDLIDDVIEESSLVAARRLPCVSVHRIAHPHHGNSTGVNLLDDSREHVAHLARAHAGDQGKSTGYPIGVEHLGGFDDLIR